MHCGWRLARSHVDSDSDAQGGYAVNDSDVSFGKNEDVKEAFDKALKSLDGADYEPVAYLGKQTVSGFNYAVLMRVTPVTLDAAPGFDIDTVYEDLDGNAEITDTESVSIDTEDAAAETKAETEA